MTSNALKTGLWFVVAWTWGITLVSCDSSSSGHATCAQQGKCGPNDQLLPAMVGACKADLANKPCTDAYQAYLDCRATNEVCLADGGMDPNATLLACSTQSDTWNACLNATAPDGGPEAGSETAPEAGSEAGTEAGADAGLEAGSDATPDTGSEATLGAGPDAALDTGSEAALDTGSEATPDGSDARSDAALGAGPEAGSDSGLDAGPEAALDAASDAGSE